MYDNKKQFQEMKKIKINEIDRTTVTDYKKIVVDTKLTIDERLKKYLEQVNNPYFLNCEGTVIKIEFLEENISLEEIFTGMLIRKKNR